MILYDDTRKQMAIHQLNSFDLHEVKEALSALAFGFISNKKDTVCRDKISEAFESEEGQNAIRNKVTLMHCTSEYPAPIEDLNLRAIRTLNQEFETSVGYSDHSTKIFIPSIAIAYGAKTIEKHFTIDKAMEGPDHSASLNPEELTEMITMIKSTYKSLGDGKKQPQTSEINNREVIRKSICASRNILCGEKYTQRNIAIRRPGNGLSPEFYEKILQKRAIRKRINIWSQISVFSLRAGGGHILIG